MFSNLRSYKLFQELKWLGLLSCKKRGVFGKRPIFGGTEGFQRKDENLLGRRNLSMKTEREELISIWPSIVNDIKTNKNADFPDVNEWIEKVLQYNVPNGKKYRGLALINSFKVLASKDDFTQENLRLVRILAWCIELWHTSAQIADDVMDESKIRRGQLCWYLKDDIGLTAINDSLIVEIVAFQLLKIHFQEKPYYIDIMETVHESLFKMCVGQNLDLQSTKMTNLDLLTLQQYEKIAKYKTGYFCFVMPVTLAMKMAKIKDQEKYEQAREICIDMGILHQVQNDFFDCYGDLLVTGDENRDIRLGKCTWPIVTTLQHVTEKQREILNECYGVDDSQHVAQVKKVYDEIDLPEIFRAHKNKCINDITNNVMKMTCGLPQNLFIERLDLLCNLKS